MAVRVINYRLKDGRLVEDVQFGVVEKDYQFVIEIDCPFCGDERHHPIYSIYSNLITICYKCERDFVVYITTCISPNPSEIRYIAQSAKVEETPKGWVANKPFKTILRVPKTPYEETETPIVEF